MSEELPETAVWTGDDVAEPGGRLPDVELDDADRRVLAVLSQHDAPTVEAAEDDPTAAAAVGDDAPLPQWQAHDDQPGDLDPVFRSPEV